MTQLRIQYPTPLTGKLIAVDCAVKFDDYKEISEVHATTTGDISELLNPDVLDRLILTTLAKEAKQL